MQYEAHSMQPDSITILCTVLTVYGGYAMFVSSKPVNLGGVVLLIVLALSTTQAVIGFTKSSTVEEKPGDVVDMMKSMFSHLTVRGVGWMS